MLYMSSIFIIFGCVVVYAKCVGVYVYVVSVNSVSSQCARGKSYIVRKPEVYSKTF